MDDDLLLELEGNHGSTPTDRDRRRRLAATAAICGLAFIGIGQLSTGALFTDSGTTDITFKTGNVQVSLNSDPSLVNTGADTKSLVLKNISNMAPGDDNYVPLQVTNAGSLKLRYDLKGLTASTPATGGSNLSDVLSYTLYDSVSSANCLAGTTGGGTVVSAAGTLPESPASPAALANDRELNAGDNEWLCLKVALPLSADNAYADGQAALTLDFNAEQTKNN
ncbi:MAG TPA: hypothetical protein VFN19_02640 [Candidatus Nanopelagicales bacterium]|jgi:hypothetical protein|nr:hypothetical protein [Candidatus Nanopelagicales bacterium]